MSGMLIRKVVRGFIKSSNQNRRESLLKFVITKLMQYNMLLPEIVLFLFLLLLLVSHLIIYSLVRYYHMMGLKTLILVPTTSLVEQMYSDFEDYGWSSGTYCQKIYQGHDKK